MRLSSLSPIRRIILPILLFLFFFSYGYFVIRKNLRPECVFNVFFEAGKAVLEGGNIYEFKTEANLGYIYPPLLAILFSPLSTLGVSGAAWAWYLANFIFLVLSFLLALKIPLEKGEKPPFTFLLLPILATALFWSHNFEYGQASLFLVFPVLAALYCYKKRLDWAAGAALGFAASIKLFPGIFLLYFLLKRRWTVLLGALAGLILFFYGIPAIVFGPREAVSLLDRWVHIALSFQQNTVRLEWTTPLDQSLSATLNRILYSSQEGAPAITPSLATLKIIIFLCINLTLLFFIFWVCRKNTDDRSGRLISIESSLFFLVIPFLTGTGWKHHFVILIPAYTTGLVLLHGGQVKWLSFPGLLFTAAFFLHVILSPAISGSRGSEWLQSHSAALVGTLFLLTAFLWIRRKPLPAADDSTAPVSLKL